MQSGFDCLGAADTAPSFSDYLKKEGVNVLADTAAQLQKQEGGKPEAKKKDEKKPAKGSWFTEPLIGPVPGWGVVGISGGLLGTAAYFLFR